MTILIIVLFVISMGMFVCSLRFGVFFFVVGIISMIACYCLCFNSIVNSATDVLSTEERVALSDDSTPATSEKLYQVVSIYDVNGNLIEQYVDGYEGN